MKMKLIWEIVIGTLAVIAAVILIAMALLANHLEVNRIEPEAPRPSTSADQ